MKSPGLAAYSYYELKSSRLCAFSAFPSPSRQLQYRLRTMTDNQGDHQMQNTNTALLQKLATAVDGHAATATFACGGSVPIREHSTGGFGPGTQNVVPSITIRWDTGSSGTTQSKVAFPLSDHDNTSSQEFDSLLHHCDPATYGVGGRDVLDEEYRKATKLDASDFSTNFHPHDCGILDSIQQILLPSTVKGGQGIGIGPQGVRAELYKLNVCSSMHGYLSESCTNNGYDRFTLHLLVSSGPMWIPHVESCSLAPSSSACLVNMKVRPVTNIDLTCRQYADPSTRWRATRQAPRRNS